MIELNRSRTSNASSDQASTPPQFGNRRLVSPGALQILENGTRRRQMLQYGRQTSSNDVRSERPATSGSEASTAPTPSLTYSFGTSPDLTLPSSPEPFVPEVRKSTALNSNPPGRGFAAPVHRSGNLQLGPPFTMPGQDTESDTFDNSGSMLLRAPPSTSPFTPPLQTIHSQALLPTREADSNDDSDEDELARTLSHLEGKSNVPSPDVNKQTLNKMFGHLKLGQDGADRNKDTFHQNAAAAEKYLAMNEAADAEPQAVGGSDDTTKIQHVAPATTNHQIHQPALSKWSNSTPSDNAASQPSTDTTAQSAVTGLRPLGSPPVARKDNASIGYPSTTPATDGRGTPADSPTVPARQSFTMLDVRKPGSVRKARENMQATTPSFARPTQAAQSKRASRQPTPHSKTLIGPETVERGRQVSAKQTGKKVDDAKVCLLCFAVLERLYTC